MTATWSSRKRLSFAFQLQQSAAASNVVANVAAVVVCTRLLRLRDAFLHGGNYDRADEGQFVTFTMNLGLCTSDERIV
jgi:hypothetical protein